MTTQKADHNGKLNEKSNKKVQKSISAGTIIGSVLVLLAAYGIGMIIREYRSGVEENQLAQAPEPTKFNDVPEIQIIEEPQPIEEVVIVPEQPVPEPVEPPPLPEPRSGTETQTRMVNVPQSQDPRLDDPVFKEELGRYALSFVGYDQAANQIWATLINDSSLSGSVRQDLIEDLNENGFSANNGRTPTVDDLPLILYRIQLIETFAPYAMDEVNADAFEEVHKDLLNMVDRLNQ